MREKNLAAAKRPQQTRFELAIVSRSNSHFPIFCVTENVTRGKARRLARQWSKVPWGTAEFVAQCTYYDRGMWWVDTKRYNK